MDNEETKTPETTTPEVETPATPAAENTPNNSEATD